MARAGGHQIGVDLSGLDDTMGRSVAAFLSSHHGEHIVLAGSADAVVVFVDLDRPGADRALTASRDDQIVIGVGFDPEPRLEGCRLYAAKPLTGAVVTDLLDRAASMIGGSPKPSRPEVRQDRLSHARDVFKPPTRWDTKRPERTAPPMAWSTDTAPRLDRAVYARAESLIEPEGSGTTASVGEMLARRRQVERIDARDAGSLTDPDVLASFRYSPSKHLDGLVRRAVKDQSGRPWEIKGAWGSLAYDPVNDTVLIAAQDPSLRVGCRQPIEGGIKARPVRAVPTGDHWRHVPREVALWNLSVWCSQGNLPDEVDPFDPITMRAWPDLARGVLTPSVLPIVALLTSGNHRPVDIAEKIGVSRTHAFVVLAGAHNLGLLEGLGTGATADPTPVARSPHRGIVRRLLGRLGAS